MALDAGASVGGVVVTADTGSAAADGRPRILLEGRGLQVDEVTGRQFAGAMASRTIVSTVYMQTMPAGIIAVVLRSAGTMAGGTLRVDIERARRPGRRGLAAVAADIRAGAAIEAGRAIAFIVEAGRHAHFGIAVVMGRSVVAGSTARADRTETENIVRIMCAGGVG